MEEKKPASQAHPVKRRCPQCYCYTMAKYSPNGTLSGTCSHCKAVFVCRKRDRETTIKIIVAS